MVINLIFSHLVAFALGGVAMAQLLQLNRRPQHPRGPIERDTSSVVQVLEHVRYHVAEARAWTSFLPSSPDQVVDLADLLRGTEAVVQRRISRQRQNLLRQLSDPALGQPWPSTTNCTTPDEHHGHD